MPGLRAVKRAVANDGARAGVSNLRPASPVPGGTAVSLASRFRAADVANHGVGAPGSRADPERALRTQHALQPTRAGEAMSAHG